MSHQHHHEIDVRGVRIQFPVKPYSVQRNIMDRIVHSLQTVLVVLLIWDPFFGGSAVVVTRQSINLLGFYGVAIETSVSDVQPFTYL